MKEMSQPNPKLHHNINQRAKENILKNNMSQKQSNQISSISLNHLIKTQCLPNK